MPDTPTRRCGSCHEVKTVTADTFYINRQGKPSSYCKPCRAAACRKWYADRHGLTPGPGRGVLPATKRCTECGDDLAVNAENFYFTSRGYPVTPCRPCQILRQRRRRGTDPDLPIPPFTTYRRNRPRPGVPS